ESEPSSFSSSSQPGRAGSAVPQAARRASEILAGGGASVTSATTGSHEQRACAPEAAREPPPARASSRPCRGAYAFLRCRGLRSLHSLHPRLISFWPSGPTAPALTRFMAQIGREDRRNHVRCLS